MAKETELKLLLRPGSLPVLLARPLLAGQRPESQRLRNTYFDTPALALMAQRVAVRERRIGRRALLTVKTAGTSVGGLSVRGEWEAPTKPGRPDFAALLGDHPLAAPLQAIAPDLVPVFRTDFHRRVWRLEHGQAQIELALDEGLVIAGQGRQARTEPLLELELELKTGPVQALHELALALAWPSEEDPARPGLWLMPSDLSKAQRGLMLARGITPEALRPEPVLLEGSACPLEAFRAIAWACLMPLQANLTRLSLDAEAFADPAFVHQSRVALRRLRTALKLFAPWLPSAFGTWRAYWQAASRRLGEVRDWDVLDRQTLPRLTPQAPLSSWIREQRDAARRDLHEALAAPAPSLALLAFARDLNRLSADDTHDQRHQALAPWALKVLDKQHRRLRKQARRMLKAGPGKRHRVRLALKRERDTLECLAGLLPARKLARTGKELARAQDVLGWLNDLDVARQRLATAPDTLKASLWPRIEAQEARALKKLPAIGQSLKTLRPPRR